VGFADGSSWDDAPLGTAPLSVVVAAPTKELQDRLAEILVR
jgi:hypothetical protein